MVLDEGLVKLEASAFAVLALLSCSRPDLTTARRFGWFILGQCLPAGQFIHVREYPAGRVRSSSKPTATGQALLALLGLFRATGEARYYQAAAQAMDALTAGSYGIKERSHWMLLAVDAIDMLSPDPANLRYAAAIAAGPLADSSYRTRADGSELASITLGLLAYLRIAARRGERSGSVALARQQVIQNLDALMRLRVPNGMFVRGHASAEVSADDLVQAGRAFLDSGPVFA